MKKQLYKNNFILIILSAAMMGITQFPFSFNVGFIAWFSLIPIIFVFKKIDSFKKIVGFSFLWGFIYHIITIFWLSQNIGTSKLAAFISMIAAVLVLSCNTIIIFSIWGHIKKKYNSLDIFILPFVWVSIEYLRSYGILGFPWINLANTQLDFYYLIQNAEYLGTYGISFWVVLINVLFYEILFVKKFEKNYLLLTFISPFIFGYFILNSIELKNIDNHKVVIIQPNVNLFTKRDFLNRDKNLDNLIDISNSQINDSLDLIIWPESALSYNNLQDKKTFEYIKDNLLMNHRLNVITGNVIYSDSKHYNSSVMFNKDKIKTIYNKRQLVPVAEYVPMSDLFPALSEINLGQANFSKGNKDVLFNINDVRFSSLICFESTFPDINRRHAKMGADYFIYLVNDGWYTGPPEPQQHMKQAIFRAIENRKTVVRCANTGISCIIDPKGKVKKQIDLNESGQITAFIEKANRGTFYTKYGNIFAVLTLLVTIWFLFGTIYEKNKK